jgi:hypothetical protein
MVVTEFLVGHRGGRGGAPHTTSATGGHGRGMGTGHVIGQPLILKYKIPKGRQKILDIKGNKFSVT